MTAVLVLLAWTGARAQEQPPEVIHLPAAPAPHPPSKSAPELKSNSAMSVQDVLAELWLRRKSLLERGEVTAAERQVQMMRDVVQREGTLSAETISGAFLVDGTRSLEAGNRQRALQSFHLANEFSPERPGAYFAVARTLWRQERDLSGAVGALREGIRATLGNPSARTTRLGNLALILLTGSVGAAVLWCLLSAFRTARLLQHDFYEQRARTLSAGPARAAALALWLLPAFLWLTAGWILVYWVALATAYMKRSERLLSVLACTCLFLAVPVLEGVTRASALTTDPTVRFLLQSVRGGGSADRIPVLEQLVASHREDALYRFLLAQTYQATGSVEAALQEYREVQRLEPRQARAWINSGNLFFSRAQYPQAAEEYQRAIEADPQSAVAHFNLYLALQASLRLEEADRAFQEARRLDNPLVTSLLAARGGEDRPEPVEAHYSSEEILARLRAQSGHDNRGIGWEAWLNPLSAAGGLGILGCLLLPWSAPRWGLGIAQRCRKCGVAYCRRCQLGRRGEEGYCTACRRLYLLKDTVTPAARQERERAVLAHERWQWIARRLASLLMPGAGQVQGGRTLLGICLLGLACLSVSAFLLSGRLLSYPGVSGVDGDRWVKIVSVCGVAVSWLAANTLAFARKT